MGSHQARVEKVTTSNWATSRVTLRALLRKEKTWHVIEEPRPEVPEASQSGPATEAQAAAIVEARERQAKWDEDDVSALSTIQMHTTTGLLILVEKVSTAREAWDNLSRSFGDKVKARSIELTRQWSNLKMEPRESVNMYFALGLRLADQLAESGEPLPERNVKQQLLAGLPEAYDSAMEVVGDWVWRDDKDIPDILARMQVTEARLNKGKAPKESAVLAAFPKRGYSGGGKGGGYKSRVQCFSCKKFGHFARDCPGHQDGIR